jgi:hypothetical protein
MRVKALSRLIRRARHHVWVYGDPPAAYETLGRGQGPRRLHQFEGTPLPQHSHIAHSLLGGETLSVQQRARTRTFTSQYPCTPLC